MDANLRRKNVPRHMTFERHLYAVLEIEARRLGIKVAHVVNQELSKRFEEKIELLRLQEKTKYLS